MHPPAGEAARDRSGHPEGEADQAVGCSVLPGAEVDPGPRVVVADPAAREAASAAVVAGPEREAQQSPGCFSSS